MSLQCCCPFWGVGRLRLSCIGIREPRLGKCNDLRLFCILTKFGMTLLQSRGETPEVSLKEKYIAVSAAYSM